MQQLVSSSALLHNALRSGTEKEMDSAARRARSCRIVRHPSTGLNLQMAGADLLDGGTGTPAVSQRSEAGYGILSAKEGIGKYDMWYDVVCKVAFMSSCMSSGSSLAGGRDMVPCITAISSGDSFFCFPSNFFEARAPWLKPRLLFPFRFVGS